MKGSRDAKEHLKNGGMGSDEKIETKFDEAFGPIAEKMMKQGMTPQEAMGVSSSYLENIYSQAYRLYNTGKYAEASHVFRILIMFNAMEPKYMLGLAACFHMLKDYGNAIQTYTMCAALDPKSPIPHYHSSDCFIQLEEYLSAMLCLELAIERAGGKPEYAKMKERAQMTLESVKKQAVAHPPSEDSRAAKELKEKSFENFFS